MKKALFLVHRYMGLALCLIMAAWCLSGVVMMYVGYPALAQRDRIAALERLSVDHCCNVPARAPDLAGIPLSSFDIEMMEDHPVLRLVDTFGPVAIVNLQTGDWKTEISLDDAKKIAADFFSLPATAASSLPVAIVGHDQWTVSGEFDADRPLFKVARGDPAGTEIYIASSSGKVVQETTRWQRGWNWVGSVVHWVYFTDLRRDPAVWSQVVIWASLLGAFLTVIGIWFGISQIRWRGGVRWTPYRGLKYWHHVAGLAFGVLTLTWVASGFLSMNPWGLLEGGGAGAESYRLRDYDLTSDDALALARRLAAKGIDGSVKRISSAPLEGRLYLREWTSNGMVRIDGETLEPAPLTAHGLRRLASLLKPGTRIESQELIRQGDSYYFAHHDRPIFPVYRVILADAQHTRYYLDPADGRLIQKTDRNARLYRWLFDAVHRWDFAAAIRQRGIWDVLMLVLMTGVSAVCLTGVYMAYSFIRGRPRREAR